MRAGNCCWAPAQEIKAMNDLKRMMTVGALAAVTAALCLAQAGCGTLTLEQNVAAGALGTTLLGARTPAQEIEQIYYLGVFDPQEQVPPTVYRVRVHGQASLISGMKFASGWVHANLIDSLGSHIEFDKDGGRVSITKGSKDELAALQTGRRLILFGPEGFREAPKDHRLVIVMGSSPDKYFEALDKSLGVVSEVMAEQRNTGINKLLLEALAKAKGERDRLDQLAKDIENDVPQPKENDQ